MLHTPPKYLFAKLDGAHRPSVNVIKIVVGFEACKTKTKRIREKIKIPQAVSSVQDISGDRHGASMTIVAHRATTGGRCGDLPSSPRWLGRNYAQIFTAFFRRKKTFQYRPTEGRILRRVPNGEGQRHVPGARQTSHGRNTHRTASFDKARIML